MTPSFDEVLSYAKRSIEHFIRKHAFQLAPEIKEEISQEAIMRVWSAYQKIDASRGWRAFVQLHCRGSVLDYIKGGKADTESELGGKVVELFTDPDNADSFSLESTMGYYGAHTGFSPKRATFSPKWDLLARMAGFDENLHIIAKILLGYTQKQIAEQMRTDLGQTISRERVSQRLYEFFDCLDDPEYLNNPWTKQCIFALGLSEYYHMGEFDNDVGWDLQWFDLIDPESFRLSRARYRPPPPESSETPDNRPTFTDNKNRKLLDELGV